jgi:hypothetical protein
MSKIHSSLITPFSFCPLETVPSSRSNLNNPVISPDFHKDIFSFLKDVFQIIKDVFGILLP